jgi:hypothetical protein
MYNRSLRTEQTSTSVSGVTAVLDALFLSATDLLRLPQKRRSYTLSEAH